MRPNLIFDWSFLADSPEIWVTMIILVPFTLLIVLIFPGFIVLVVWYYKHMTRREKEAMTRMGMDVKQDKAA